MRLFYIRRPLRFTLCMVAAFFCGRAEAQQALKLAQPDVGRFPEVRLFAYPTDPAGQVLENLSAGQFRVTEDGRPATVLDVRGGASGSIALCLVLDRSGSMEEVAGQGAVRKIDAAYDAARQFVRSLRVVDRAGVISFSDRASLDHPLTGSKDELLAALQTPTPEGQTALYDAIHDAIQQVALRPQGGNNSDCWAARRQIELFAQGLIGRARSKALGIDAIGDHEDLVRREALNLAQVPAMLLRHNDKPISDRGQQPV